MTLEFGTRKVFGAPEEQFQRHDEYRSQIRTDRKHYNTRHEVLKQ